MKKRINDNYLIIGFVLSIFLQLLQLNWNILYVGIFSLIYIIFNINYLFKVIDKTPKIYLLLFALLLIGNFLENADLKLKVLNIIMQLAYMLIIISGVVFFSSSSLNIVITNLKRIQQIILISAIWGIYCFIVGNNAIDDIFKVTVNRMSSRIDSIFLQPIIAAVIFLVGILLTCYLYNNTLRKICMLAILIIGLILTQSRSVLVIAVLILICYMIKKIKFYSKGLTYNQIVIWSLALVVLFFIIIEFYNFNSSFLKGIFNDRTLDSHGQDISYSWRHTMIDLFLNNVSFTDFNTYFGNGYHASVQLIKSLNFNWLFYYSFNVVDNEYVSIFYDCGLMGLFVYILLMLANVISYIRSKNEFSIVLSLIVLAIFAESYFFDALDWCNITFIFCSFMLAFLSFRSTTKNG